MSAWWGRGEDKRNLSHSNDLAAACAVPAYLAVAEQDYSQTGNIEYLLSSPARELSAMKRAGTGEAKFVTLRAVLGAATYSLGLCDNCHDLLRLGRVGTARARN